MNVETVLGRVVTVGEGYFGEPCDPIEKVPFTPDPMIKATQDALQEIRRAVEPYRGGMIILEAADDDKGGRVFVYTTPMSRDRAMVMIGKAGQKVSTHNPTFPKSEPSLPKMEPSAPNQDYAPAKCRAAVGSCDD